VLAGQPQQFERTIRKPSGDLGYGLAHYIPDRKDDAVIGFFVLVTDVTPLKLAEAELREINEKLEQALAESKAASAVKSQFLTNMSHEIRTPMNAVLGFLGLALESELPDDIRRQLTTAHNSARSLLLMINDILDISRLQSGTVKLSEVIFNLPMILRSSLEVLQIKARNKGLELQFYYQPGLPHCYLGDPARIRQIATNLVSNAIKFTETGSITVSVVAADDPGLVEMTVNDTGIGMTAEQAGRIFTLFVQADSSTTRQFGGTGLGVSLCQQLAELMGGRIWVESQPGVGSSFHATLRLALVSCALGCPDHGLTTQVPVQAKRRFRVLLADDIPENTELGEIRLTAQGHGVTVVRDGLEAVEMAGTQAFDVILMDVQMPVMSGLDATREIRRREGDARPPVPIIAMTASVMPSERHQCFEAGMTDFIAKPVDFAELFQLLETVVPAGRGQAVTVAEVPLHRAAQVLPPLNGIDVTSGLRRWSDADRYGAALASFPVKYGDVARRLDALHAAGSWQTAYQLAHALKGVAGNLAVSEVACLAAALSNAFKTRRVDGVDGLILELAGAIGVVAASIDRLHQDHARPAEESLPVTKLRVATAITSPALVELLAALETDDPGTVEPVLKRVAASLSPGDAARLHELIDEFEFERARKFVAAIAGTTINASHPLQ